MLFTKAKLLFTCLVRQARLAAHRAPFSVGGQLLRHSEHTQPLTVSHASPGWLPPGKACVAFRRPPGRPGCLCTSPWDRAVRYSDLKIFCGWRFYTCMPNVAPLEGDVLNSHSHENIVKMFLPNPDQRFLGRPLESESHGSHGHPWKSYLCFSCCIFSRQDLSEAFLGTVSNPTSRWRNSNIGRHLKKRVGFLWGSGPRRGRGSAAPLRCRAFRTLPRTPWLSAWRVCHSRCPHRFHSMRRILFNIFSIWNRIWCQ